MAIQSGDLPFPGTTVCSSPSAPLPPRGGPETPQRRTGHSQAGREQRERHMRIGVSKVDRW